MLQTSTKDCRQPPPAVARPLKNASGGRVPTPSPQDHAQEAHYLPEWSRPGIWPGGRIFGGDCSPTTLVAGTTSYFSSRNFRQSLVLTLLQIPVGFKVIYGRLHSKRHIVVSSSTMPSKRKRHSWLSPIVVACCKSNKETTKAR